MRDERARRRTRRSFDLLDIVRAPGGASFDAASAGVVVELAIDHGRPARASLAPETQRRADILFASPTCECGPPTRNIVPLPKTRVLGWVVG